MPRVLLICPDAFLRERLAQRLRDGEDMVLVEVPPADAVVVGEPVLTEAQKECLQMYVECGSVEQVAMRRGCSVHTVKHHLLSAQRRLGAKNCAQLVHRAWCSGVLTLWSSTKALENWHKSSIDRNEGGGRLGVENSKRGRTMRYLPATILLIAAVALTSWSQNVDGCPSCGERHGGGLVLEPQEAAYINPQHQPSLSQVSDQNRRGIHPLPGEYLS